MLVNFNKNTIFEKNKTTYHLLVLQIQNNQTITRKRKKGSIGNSVRKKSEYDF